MWFGNPVQRNGDKREVSTKAEEFGDTVDVEDEMSIMSKLRRTIDRPAKFILALICSRRSVGLDCVPGGKKVIWWLDLLSILEILSQGFYVNEDERVILQQEGL